MAPFAYLAPRDRMALAHHVQSLGKFPHADAPAALEALGKELASAAVFHPNRIPVSRAMGKLAAEDVAPKPIPLPAASDRSPGAEALRVAVADPVRAGRTLAATPVWRSGPADLARAATADAPANGFAVAAGTLPPAAWEALHAELTKRIGP
jgi:hypothetical protein